MFTRPTPTTCAVPLERLTFPPQCQQRMGLPAEPPDLKDANREALIAACWRPDHTGRLVCVADPAVAGKLAEWLADHNGTPFDALEVVHEAGDPKRKKPERWYVFGGFTRGAAYQLYGKAHSVPCNVYEGTLQDALFWSLSENHKNVQTRGRGSARRSVETLLDSAALLDRCRAEAPRLGGLVKAIAAACQVSYSFTAEIISARNFSVQGTQLVPKQPKPSIQSLSFVGNDKAQTSAPINSSAPAPTPAPSAADADAEQLWTVPADFGAESEADPEPEGDGDTYSLPDAVIDGVLTEVKDGIAADRAKLDQVIRLAKELDDAIRGLRLGIVGPLLSRMTVDGRAVIAPARLEESDSRGKRWLTVPTCSVGPRELIDVLRRVRPKSVCAGCRGAHGGCTACNRLGFIPFDESLIHPDAQQVIDLPDPRTVPANPAPWEEGGAA
jgi:hypothetical protein